MEQFNNNNCYEDDGLFGDYYCLQDFKKFVEKEKAKGFTEQYIFHKIFNGWKNASSACNMNSDKIEALKNKK